MKKILFIAHLPDLSGASQVLLDVLDCVDRSGFEIEVACPGEGPFAEAVSARNIPFRIIENPARSLAEAPDGLSRLALMRKRTSYMAGVRRRIRTFQPDLVFINSLINIYAGIAARSAGARIAYHIHEVFPRTPANRVKLWIVRRCADSIITVSRKGAEEFSAKARARKVRTIYNGVDLRRFAFDPARRRRMREKLGLSDNHVAFGNIGFLTPRKGIEYFLEAARRALDAAENCRFFVIGDSYPWTQDYRASLLTLAARNQLHDRVRFLPFSRDVESYYSALDVLTLSSVSESLPRVVIEAMAASVPVIATDVGGVRECIEDRVSGIVTPPRRADRLAEAMADLARHPEKRTEYARRALETVERRFSLERFRREFQAFFDEACQPGRGAISNLEGS